MKDIVNKALKAQNLLYSLDSEFNKLSYKQKRKATKKLKRLLKELEFLRRTGGLTVVIEDDTLITTYHNNSLNRKKTVNNKKVIY